MLDVAVAQVCLGAGFLQQEALTLDDRTVLGSDIADYKVRGACVAHERAQLHRQVSD